MGEEKEHECSFVVRAWMKNPFEAERCFPNFSMEAAKG
jgi:hypothetical protein